MARGITTNDSLVAIGDVHAPFHCATTLATIIKAIETVRPRFVVQMGDLYDQYAFSRYGKSLNLMTPADELAAGLDTARTFWAAVKKASPASRCYQLLGNHDERLRKKVAEKLPELVGLVDTSSLFAFPGVESMKTDKEVLELTVQGERVALHHGYLSRAGDHVKKFHRSCITAHSHRPHVMVHRIHGKSLYDLNPGYVGNPEAPVFDYGTISEKGWTRAYGVIDSLGPRFVSLEASA
jgi:UDP-2,3-diacylglucosamine pyrophosphatase LpxH